VKPRWFRLEELVPRSIFEARGDAAWELLDARALATLDELRDRFGPIVVNDWHAGGRFDESGLRGPYSRTGASFSQHRFGRAFDCKFKDVTPSDVHAYVRAHAAEFPHLTTLEQLEATPSWVHFDVRANAGPGLRIVKP